MAFSFAFDEVGHNEKPHIVIANFNKMRPACLLFETIIIFKWIQI